MHKPTIAIDIDDVLAQGTESLRLQVNQRLGVNLTPEHYRIPGSYRRYYETVWKEHGILERIDWEELNSQMLIDQSHVPVVPKAAATLRKLKRTYDLVVITARETTWEAATRDWVEAQFPGIFSTVHFAGRHDGTTKPKGELCVELGAAWLIDDNVEHAHTALERGIQVLLFGSYGWHKNIEIHKDVVRCKDWTAVLEYFDGIGRS